MKTIHIEAFDKSSVDKAIEEVKAIKKEWRRKAKEAEKLIAEELANLINENLMNVAIGDDLKDIKTHQQVISPPGVERGQEVIRLLSMAKMPYSSSSAQVFTTTAVV